MPKEINGYFNCSKNILTTLEGCSEEIKGYFDCSNNNLISINGRPKKIKGIFNCRNNPELKNIKQQIIENQMVAEKYFTDDEVFYFEDIKEEFEKYNLNIKNTKVLKNKHNIDYGLSI